MNLSFRNRRLRRFALIWTLALVFACVLSSAVAWAETSTDGSAVINENLVYAIKIDDDINSVTASYVERAYQQAEADNAAYMFIDLNTYGGYASAASSIKQTIVSSPIETICFVDDKAISAGALIALACDEIVMAPGATMGAAEPRSGGEIADEKVISYWAAEMASTAEINGRDGEVAAALVDSDISIPGIIEQDKLLTLSTAQALRLGMADGEATSKQVVLEQYDLSSAVVIQVEMDFQEQMANFLSSSVISTLLLAIGISALVLELIFAGTGIAGAIGAVALALYFAGGFMVGNSGWLALLLIGVALVMLIMEIFVMPGFGVFGILGICSMVAAVIVVAPSMSIALIQMAVAIVVVIGLVILSLKMGKTRRMWNKLILKDSTSTEEGYVSQPTGINSYLGKGGVALTDLRPSGAALIGDERVDVVTEGSFITVGDKIVVIKVDGSSVIVRKTEEA